MAKLTKPITGVRAGDVYPSVLAAGEDCPPELEAAAEAMGALPARKAAKAAPETK